MREIKLLPREYAFLECKFKSGKAIGFKEACAELRKISKHYSETTAAANISDDDKKKNEEWISVFDSIAKSIEVLAKELEKESAELFRKAVEMWPEDRSPCLCMRLKNAIIGCREGWSKET